MALQSAGLLVVYLLLISILTSWSDHQEVDQEQEKRYHTPTTRCNHPCKGTVKTKTIDTPNGKIFCVVPTVQELTDQLTKIGGYNRHYVAITLEEAEANFVDQLPSEIAPTPHKCRGHRHKHRHKLGYKHKLWARSDPSNIKEIESREREEKRQVLCLTPRCQTAGQQTTEGIRTCPACQSCRELPSNYFPRYVNEVSCDNSTDSTNSMTHHCYLIPDGSCMQKEMTIDVLSKEEERYELIKENRTSKFYRQVWNITTIAINSCCECFT